MKYFSFEWYLARKLRQQKNSFSSVVVRIAIIGIALGMSLIIVAFGVLFGFRKAVQDKLFSFTGHLQVFQLSQDNPEEESAISKNTYLYQNFNNIASIQTLYGVSRKAGIIKSQDEVLGVMLKGLGRDYPTGVFLPNLKEGSFLKLKEGITSNEVVISEKISKKLKIKLKDTITVFFVQNPPRARPLVVAGIYETGLEGFDEKVIICDLALIQKLNNWSDSLVGSYEIILKDFTTMSKTSAEVYEYLEYYMEMQKITDLYPDIFDWLLLLNNNVRIFLALIMIVIVFNMVAILLIMIMERTQMIGILKALGAHNSQIRRIFVYQGFFLVLRGMVFGNFFGIGACALQYFFHLIPLDAENYYMNTVPIAWDWSIVLLINLLTLFTITVVLILPTAIISNIKPIKAIRFQ